jgi:phenol 2-monooxygenase
MQATLELIKLVNNFTYPDKDLNSVINPVVVLATERKDLSQSQIPDFYTPSIGHRRVRCKTTGPSVNCGIGKQWNVGLLIRNAGLHNVFTDEAGPYSPHGHAYEKYGVDPSRGALVVVRPDHCMDSRLFILDLYMVSSPLRKFLAY